MNNAAYVDYHDNEWGRPVHDERKLLELLILEGFQAGLSWECILNKREAFRRAFDNFEIDAVSNFDGVRMESLMRDGSIVRNRLKIEASVRNALAFKDIAHEFGSFDNYIWGFTNGQTLYENGKTSSSLSDVISKDLKMRGMKFVGTTIVYSYLQAIGVINSHDEVCWLHKVDC